MVQGTFILTVQFAALRIFYPEGKRTDLSGAGSFQTADIFSGYVWRMGFRRPQGEKLQRFLVAVIILFRDHLAAEALVIQVIPVGLLIHDVFHFRFEKGSHGTPGEHLPVQGCGHVDICHFKNGFSLSDVCCIHDHIPDESGAVARVGIVAFFRIFF